ncbi:site-specific integrase, partial [Mycobacterium kansasii]
VLHENAVTVGADVHVGTLKSGKERTVVLPTFVVDELAKTCRGKQHGDLIWPARDGGHLGPPSSHDSWLSGAVDRCQAAAVAARKREGKE